MSSEYLDAINHGTRALMDVSSELQSLASAFSRTGNLEVSAELAEIAITVNSARKEIDDAVGRKIHGDCMDSQRQAGETLRLIMDAAIKDSAP